MRLLIIISAILLLNNHLHSQTTIYTPTGVSIQAYDDPEASWQQLVTWEAEAADHIRVNKWTSPERVAPASATYNCHGYAWHYSDGGGTYWIYQYTYPLGYANVSKYFSGSSPAYQQASYSDATKAFYPYGDHSAKVISSTLFESKWGAWPRYRHWPLECPYDYTNLQWYKVPLNGDDVICSSSKNYSTLNISGGSYNWSGSGISISGSGYSVTASKTSDGSGSIQCQISSPYSGTTITAKKDLWGGLPAKPNTLPNGDPDTAQIWYHSPASILLIDAPGSTIYSGNWSADWPWIVECTYNGGHQADFYAWSLPYAPFSVYTTNECGDSPTHYGWFKVICPDPPCDDEEDMLLEEDMKWSIIPNPASDYIDISIDDLTQSIIKNYDASIISVSDSKVLINKKLDGSLNRINIQDLSNGSYIVRLHINNKVYQKVFIK